MDDICFIGLGPSGDPMARNVTAAFDPATDNQSTTSETIGDVGVRR